MEREREGCNGHIWRLEWLLERVIGLRKNTAEVLRVTEIGKKKEEFREA